MSGQAKTSSSSVIISAAIASPQKSAAHYRRHEGGATAIEYGLIAAGVALAIAVSVILLGSSLTASYTRFANLF